MSLKTCPHCKGSAYEIEGGGYKCFTCAREFNFKPMEGKRMETKVKMCPHHPDRPAQVAASGRSLGVCRECLMAARMRAAKNRMAKREEPAADRAKVLEERRKERNKKSQIWRDAKKAAAETPIPSLTLQAELRPKSETMKIFCMRCGFSMEFNPGGLTKEG